MLADAAAAAAAADAHAPAGARFDVVLFIGMAIGRQHYTLETRAHRDGYLYPDDDGETARRDGTWRDAGAPEVLRTDFDTGDVWRRWATQCPVGPPLHTPFLPSRPPLLCPSGLLGGAMSCG